MEADGSIRAGSNPSFESRAEGENPSGGALAIAITGASRGVGNTSIAANLALSMARLGQRTCILDADLRLAHVDALLGLTPRGTLADVIAGGYALHDIVLNGPMGVAVIPGSRCGLGELTPAQRLWILDEFDSLGDFADVLIIDTAPGLSGDTLHFASAAEAMVVVTAPDRLAVTGAYALIKALARDHARRELHVLVNRTRSSSDARRAFAHLSRVAEHFLGVELRYLGFVPFDAAAIDAVRRGEALALSRPDSALARSLCSIGRRLLEGRDSHATLHGGPQFFFRRLLSNARALPRTVSSGWTGSTPHAGFVPAGMVG